MSNKSALRLAVRARLKQLSKEGREGASSRLAALLKAERAWRSARRIFAFIPLPSEPDCREAFLPHQEILVPVGAGSGGDMNFELLLSLPGARQISPSSGLPCWPTWRFNEQPQLAQTAAPRYRPAAGDIVLVPGIAFTAQGARLGRGGGFYDRFLASCPPGVGSWGLAFACQIVDTLPEERHDQRVQRVAVADDSAAWWVCGQQPGELPSDALPLV